MRNPRTTAAIAGHPIHPMLIPFPIAFFIAAFVSDIAYLSSANAGWATASLWLLGVGLIMAALAAVTGVIEVAGEPRIREYRAVWYHAGGNVLAVLIELYNWYSRYSAGGTTVTSTQFVLSLIAVVLLAFTGWMGGELVFRHRVGVADGETDETIARTGRP